MVDNRNENFLKTGEKPPEPEEARLHAIDSFVGAATVAVGASYPDIVGDPSLAPFMGGHVADHFEQRNNQRLGVEQVAAPALQAAEVEAPEMTNEEYLDHLAEPDVASVAEISAGARNAVMDSTVDAGFNGLREVA